MLGAIGAGLRQIDDEVDPGVGKEHRHPTVCNDVSHRSIAIRVVKFSYEVAKRSQEILSDGLSKQHDVLLGVFISRNVPVIVRTLTVQTAETRFSICR
ncbi:hypothetical protein ACFX2G_025743 [Malus domestica]